MAAAETVTVACKLPAGLIADIRAEPKVMHTSQGDHLIAGPVLASVTFTGSAAQRRLEAGGQVLGEAGNVVGGYGITPNVDKQFWDKWFEENKDYAPVAKGLIFALPSANAVRSEARDRAGVKNGMEPADRKDMAAAGVEVRTDKD
jgi:hypothetical protein